MELPHLLHVTRGDPVDVLDNLTHFVFCEWPPFLKLEHMTNPKPNGPPVSWAPGAER